MEIPILRHDEAMKNYQVKIMETDLSQMELFTETMLFSKFTIISMDSYIHCKCIRPFYGGFTL